MNPWHILASLFLFALKRIYSPIYLDPRYPCPVEGCDKRLTRPEKLRGHLKTHADVVTQEDIDKADTTIKNVTNEKKAASRANRLTKKKSDPPKPRGKKKDK